MKALFEAFGKAGRELYLVGGAVRDLAMGKKWEALDDLDFATNARPEESLDILQRAGFKTYDVGIEFGTVGTLLRGPREQGFPKDVQVTTYRSSETYQRKSRHPVVTFGKSIDDDLWRRDFSINSIAMDAQERFVDPYNGRQDIANGVLRAVGDPRERLAEDPLRILRIARFMAKLGFAADEALERAAHERAPWLLDIARQRWLQEMGKLIQAKHPRPALEFLLRTRALGIILPELAALVALDHHPLQGGAHPSFWKLTLARAQAAPRGDEVLAWAAILADLGRPSTRGCADDAQLPGEILAGLAPDARASMAQGEARFERHFLQAAALSKGIARRFHFDNDTADAVAFLLEHQRAALDYDPSWSDAQVRRFVRDMQGHHKRVIALGKALQHDPKDADPRVKLADLEAHIARLEAQGQLIPVLPKELGSYLMKHLGVRPGPILGELIAWITAQILDGHIASGLAAADYADHLRREAPPILSRV
jgi:poly(A) polymerase